MTYGVSNGHVTDDVPKGAVRQYGRLS